MTSIPRRGERAKKEKIEASPDIRSVMLLLDSSPTFRRGLSESIRKIGAPYTVVEAGTVVEAMERTALQDLTIAVIEIDLPDMSGIGLGQQWMKLRPDLPVVLLGHNDWDIYLASAMAIKAAGFLLRSAPTEDLVNSIQLATVRPIYSAQQLARVRVSPRVRLT